MTPRAWLSAVAIAAMIVAATGSAFDVIGGDGDALNEDTTVKPVEHVPMPDNVVVATEGSLWKLKRKHDVVVLAVTQHYDCATCADALKGFAAAARNFTDAAPGTVKFAVLDAVDEADEFSLLMDENPDWHWYVPAILVLKREYMEVFRRPPISFLINENTARDLPRFVKRMIGKDMPVVTTEQQLRARIFDDGTERVSFVAWPWDHAARNAIERIASTERLHVFFTRVGDGELSNVDGVGKTYNPTGDFFTVYVAKPDGTFEVHGTSLTNARDFTSQMAALREFVERFKRRRPGHEDDGTRSITTEDLVPGGSCDGKRMTKTGDKVVASGAGVNLHTGTTFLSFDREVVEVGKERGDLPHGIAASAFMNLCAPAQRKIVLPAQKHYTEERLPPNVGTEDSIRFDLTLHGFADEPESDL